MNAPALPSHLLDATDDQPGARAALAAALAAGPSHAYLFAGPAPATMRATARAFAAELLAQGAPEPDSARRRALADPSPHPDLVWLRPPGGQHLVEDVREQVIKSAAYRPFEGERRVFVIEAAEAMADESQNALLKTLEEPPPFAHLLLLSSEPDGLRATVTSRCQSVRFAALAPAAVEEALRDREPEIDTSTARTAARLCGGDPGLASLLISVAGRELREATEGWALAVRSGELADAPWRRILELAEAQGAEAAAESERIAADRAEAGGERASRRGTRDAQAAARRAGRRRRTERLDLALALLGAWFRDLAALGEGGPELVLTADRSERLASEAEGLDPRRARRAVELVLETRRRLRVNVSEELALEALSYRVAYLLTSN